VTEVTEHRGRSGSAVSPGSWLARSCPGRTGDADLRPGPGGRTVAVVGQGRYLPGGIRRELRQGSLREDLFQVVPTSGVPTAGNRAAADRRRAPAREFEAAVVLRAGSEVERVGVGNAGLLEGYRAERVPHWTGEYIQSYSESCSVIAGPPVLVTTVPAFTSPPTTDRRVSNENVKFGFGLELVQQREWHAEKSVEV
jgi:hypothetical protein